MQYSDYPPGLMPGAVLMSNEEYHGNTSRISKSGISKMAKSPGHYYAAYLDPKKPKHDPTPAMISGTIVHTAVLERDDFDNQFKVAPVFDRRTTVGKEGYARFTAELGNKKMCSADDYELAMRISESVYKHPAAKELLRKEDIVTEQTFLFEEPITGAPCKVRPDAINRSMSLGLDLKTAEDGSPFGFGKSAAGYEYDIQPPMYIDGVYEAGGILLRGFVFIAVEKVYPFAVSCHYMPPRAMASGREKYIERLRVYMSCLETQKWPLYSDKVEQLLLPEWAYHDNYKKASIID